MTQRIWDIVDSGSGVVVATITADTEQHGIAVEHVPTWHSYNTIEQFIAHMNTANQWLLDNGGVA